jgi:hypothetical protein
LKIVIINREACYLGKVQKSRSIEHRLIYPFSRLAKQGVLEYFIDDEDDIPLTGSYFDDIDYAIFCRNSSEKSLAIHCLLKEKNIDTVYDIDDLMEGVLPDFYSKEGVRAVQIAQKHIELASTITVENDNLKTKMGLSKACVIPNVIDLDDFSLSISKNKGAFKIVFVNAAKLKVNAFRDDFLKLLKDISEDERFELHLLVDDITEFGCISNYIHHSPSSWFEHLFKLGLESFSIALVPLGGDEDRENIAFNECKSPIKFLNYTAMGTVGIYSKVEPYMGVIEDGIDGFLVDNNYQDWKSVVERCYADRSGLELILAASEDKVRAHYNIEKALGCWKGIFT